MEETFDTSPFRRHNTENAAYVVNRHAQGNRCLSAFSEIAKKFLKSVLTWFNNTRRFNLPVIYRLESISIEIVNVLQNLRVILPWKVRRAEKKKCMAEPTGLRAGNAPGGR